MSCCITRRKLLSLVGTTLGAGVGEPTAAKVGGEILARGGNAVDAAVAAALAAGVAAPHQCGPGGYGGHMTIAMAGKKVTFIGFNSRAPAAMREDTGLVNGRLNPYGWLAAGVPGTMAGVQLALDLLASRLPGAVRQAYAGGRTPSCSSPRHPTFSAATVPSRSWFFPVTRCGRRSRCLSRSLPMCAVRRPGNG